MSSDHHTHMPQADQHDYHADREQRRVEAAKKLIDAGDIIAIVESRLASESDPTQHPLYPLVQFYLDREIAVHGGLFYDHWKRLILAAISTAIDDALECLED